MPGQYYKLNDDGAPFRCTVCKKLYPHSQVILFQHTEKPNERGIICTSQGNGPYGEDCLDAEWYREAQCIGKL